MKRYLVILAAAALAVLASCNKEASRMDLADEGLAPVEFTLDGDISASVGTRATEVTTANLSSMNVTATTGSSSETAVSGFSNAAFTKSGSVWKGGKYWPASNPSYHFYASNVTMTHTTSGQTVSPANAGTDVVVGYLASPTYKSTNALTLGHIFAQIGTMAVTAPDNYTVSELKVSVAPKTSGTYNLKSGSWTAKGSAGSATYILGNSSTGVSITTAGGTTTSSDNDLWLVPDTYTLSFSYKLAIGDYQSATISKTATVTLAQGKNNNISATLQGGDASEIQLTVTVTPWSNENQYVTWN